MSSPTRGWVSRFAFLIFRGLLRLKGTHISDAKIDPQRFRDFEISGWNAKVDAYHRFFSPITSRFIEPLLDAAQVGPGKKTLDVASGPGYVSARIAQRGAAVIGIDIAAHMVELARKLHPAIEFRQADAERLPFPNNSFDAVVGNFIVPHLSRPEAAGAELTRVLAPDGWLALSMWDVPARSRLMGLFVDAMEEAGAKPPSDLPLGPPIYRYSSDDEFSALLCGAGLIDTSVNCVAFSYHLPSADELWNGTIAGGVRTSALILGQTPDVQTRIRAAFDRLAREYWHDGALEIPVSAKIASGRKPQS